MAAECRAYGEHKDRGLGVRLLAAAALVRVGRPAADIGCDHGKLAVYLVKNGISPRVVAVDNRPMPLVGARLRVQRAGCGKLVDCRLGDGLEPLTKGEADDIVVAGLSGQTMLEIFGRCTWLETPDIHLVLVPASLHTRLRRWLCQHGFEIDTETPLLENGRCYTVISAFYTARGYTPSALFCQVGYVPRAGGAAAQVYIQKRLAHLRRKSRAAKTAEEQTAHRRIIEEVRACLPLGK